jgi:anaerobic selenocysteine-containing dehydrogenase
VASRWRSAERQFTRIRGDDEHPGVEGLHVPEGRAAGHYQDNADRLTHPLRRMPDGSYERTTWEQALGDIAARLLKIRASHGGRAFAFYGGGGQGNHLGGGIYGRQLQKAMKSRYLYNSLAQEKTGDFWANGRLFGKQTCHTTEDVEHADFVLVIGANPWQAHGIPNARDTLRDIKQDPKRTLVVIDPRRTETAKTPTCTCSSARHRRVPDGGHAGHHRAGGLHDRDVPVAAHHRLCPTRARTAAVPVADYVPAPTVPLADVQRVARGFAQAESACVRVDLGIQQSPRTTLNGYLEKLLFLVTGNFGKRGGNNLHTFLLPVIGHTDERSPKYWRTANQGMHAISGIYPPNILPAEIAHAGDDRVRALFVDSANPAVTAADSQAYARALGKLELLVVVDVAFTETARLADYVLPAASQFEKWECTGFNLEFPVNAFQLRKPLFEPLGESLPEAEIYTRLLEAMGELPKRFPLLERIARSEPEQAQHLAFLGALGATLVTRPKLAALRASVLYRTLGQGLARRRGVHGVPAAAGDRCTPGKHAPRCGVPATRATAPRWG